MAPGRGDADDSAWKVFTGHPLVWAGKFVLIPYFLYIGYYYLRLQRPEYVSLLTGGLIRLRPAVHGTATPRQLLIVASPGSGTVQMAAELRTKLSLEVGHESADAAWDFTRDGSVSWFHGIRFLPPLQDRDAFIQGLGASRMCQDAETMGNMGFHPAMYGPPRGRCSYRSKWDECWKGECYVALLREWGCAASDGWEFAKGCETKFAKNLHQVRHPVRTLESLAAKFCIGGLEGLVAGPFLTFASLLFPGHDFYADSCVEAAGFFVASYLEAMEAARANGTIDAFYRIEDASACDVAEAAGLLSSGATVYAPNHERIATLCDPDHHSPAQEKVQQKMNQVNKGQVQLDWQDLRGGMHGSRRKKGDRTLEERLRKLCRAFGYDENETPLQNASPVEFRTEL